MQKHLLLISFHPPALGTGSPIILKRHLQRLEQKDWRISVVAPEHYLYNKGLFPDTWQLIPLIKRRWWWPPYRDGIPGSINLRSSLWQFECEKILGEERPTAILTVLWDVYPMLAVKLSKNWKVPLSVLIHDQEENWAKTNIERDRMKKRAACVFNHASRIWPVSRELSEAYQIENHRNLSVLYPIPEQHSYRFAKWKNSFQDNPVIAHAGSLHSFQLPNLRSVAQTLQKINGTLLLITSHDNPTLLQLLKLCPNVKWHEPFKQNLEVVNFLQENASCVLISYSFLENEQPWAATSFPSRLVEFSKLGLPTLILAPPSAAVSKWAYRHRWLFHVDQLNDSMLLSAIKKLIDQDDWLKLAKQTREIALEEFCPDQIQEQFESELVVKYGLPNNSGE